MYDQTLTPTQRSNKAVELSSKTREELTNAELMELNYFEVAGSRARFSVAIVANEEYLSKHTSSYPLIILLLSAGLVIIAQLERWIGHPSIISQSSLVRAKIEAELRAEVEADIIER